MRRRLSKREKRLILFLGVAAVLALVGFSLAPREPPTLEDVIAYYVNAFDRAQEITIRPAQGDAEAVTITREEAATFFAQLSMLSRYAMLSPAPSPHPPKWVLDITIRNGSRIEGIQVGYHLDGPKQPARGEVWVVPNTPGRRDSGALMVAAIDRYLKSREEGKPEEGSE